MWVNSAWILSGTLVVWVCPYDFNCLELINITTGSPQIEVLCDVLYGQIVHGSYSLKSFEPEHVASFIQFGFARTKSGENVIDEPLAIMAMWNWLGGKGHFSAFSLFDCLQRKIGTHAPRKNGSE
jgi:hypothetical protein